MLSQARAWKFFSTRYVYVLFYKQKIHLCSTMAKSYVAVASAALNLN